jgi:hypothetical protein
MLGVMRSRPTRMKQRVFTVFERFLGRITRSDEVLGIAVAICLQVMFSSGVMMTGGDVMLLWNG